MRFRKLKNQKNHPKKSQTQEKKSYLVSSYTARIKAFIIDMFMVYAPILYILTYLILDGKEAFLSSELAPLFGVTLYGLIYAFLLSKFGQTPGKKAYGLRVLNARDGKNISFFQAILRFVGFLFSATILIGLLFPLYRKDKKGLHDLIASTIEVKEKETL